MQPKVSVIIPNYNHAPYLKQRFDSIFNQTFQDFEVIILDDCSTDNSKEIIEQYRSNPKVSHIVYNEKNSGSPFKQWAKGFDLAKGEYIWIAESDDWAELTFLEKLEKNLAKNGNFSLVFCNSIFEFKNHKEIGYPSEKEHILKSQDLLRKKFIYDNFICNASSALFRKKYINQIPQNYLEYLGSGDYLFWIYLAECGDFFFHFEPLNHFRRHEKNTTETNRKSARLYIENLKIHKYLQKKGYISFYEKQSIVLSYIDQIKRDSLLYNGNKDSFNQALKLWNNEIFSTIISKIIVKCGKTVWDLLH